MNILPATALRWRLACALALCAAAGSSQAQAMRSVQPAAPSAMAPSLSTGALPGGPSPAGLTSPLPSPGGLGSRFPAGLPSPIPSPAGLPSPTVPTPASPGSPVGSAPIDANVVSPRVMGAGTTGGVSAAPQSLGAARGTYTALQVAQSFLAADSNRDGELTRAEAQRLNIMPSSFEEMDRNRDGILSRFEYEDGVR